MIAYRVERTNLPNGNRRLVALAPMKSGMKHREFVTYDPATTTGVEALEVIATQWAEWERTLVTYPNID